MGRNEDSKLPIPQDWDGHSYGYVLACFPWSLAWRSAVRGKIYELTRGRTWDRSTGNIKATQAIAEEILGSACFMSCDDLFNALGQIRDAIINKELSIDLSNIETAIIGISDTVRATLTYNDKDLGEYIKNLVDKTENVADRVDDLGTDLGMVRDEVTSLSQNINLTLSDPQGNFIATLTGINMTLADIKQELFNLDELGERMLVYEGTKTSFYGQTMTTQSQELRNIAQQILEKNLSVTVNIPLGIAPPPEVEIPSEFFPASNDEACVAALAYFNMQGELIGILSTEMANIGAWPFNAADYFVALIRGFISAFLTRDPITALTIALQLWQTYALELGSQDWEAIEVEFSQNKDGLVCIYKNFAETGDDDAIRDFYNNSLSQTLGNLLGFADLNTFFIYASNMYTGDNSQFWDNFNRHRTIVMDGYSEGYCDDCPGGGE